MALMCPVSPLPRGARQLTTASTPVRLPRQPFPRHPGIGRGIKPWALALSGHACPRLHSVVRMSQTVQKSGWFSDPERKRSLRIAATGTNHSVDVTDCYTGGAFGIERWSMVRGVPLGRTIFLLTGRQPGERGEQAG